ncbi:hypothetical protein A3L09_04650 [Thermococcus profundus]|uniref:Uncharacterized protein n=1 Tax=Thermococcus profundus TaxID=49899 RepID=A0A2Z2MKV6_THEPR|nr:hypothetical protein [Thermococcus profundus]ASJ02598.1 hypothetical protein A3L09_04650 [Thermococcus profundus]
MIEFVILLGVIGGWFIAATTLLLMLVFGKMWGLLGVFLLVLGVELNKFLKRRYMGVIVSNSPRAREVARHIFEMNELIILSSYAAALFLYIVVQKYVEIVIKVPAG